MADPHLAGLPQRTAGQALSEFPKARVIAAVSNRLCGRHRLHRAT